MIIKNGNPLLKQKGQKTVLSLAGLFVAALYMVSVSGCMTSTPESPVVTLPPAPKAELAVRKLDRTFNSMGYTLASVTTGQVEVPRLVLTGVPHGNDSAEKRKSVFLRALLSLVLMENENIMTSRDRLLRIKERVESKRALSAPDQEWVDRLADRYKVERGDLTELAMRVDVVPPSLALAQAAEESGWGSSRFAQEGNALYGQWTWSEGIVPANRISGKNHAVKVFASPSKAVAAYIHNLNTHRAYRGARGLRALDRARGAEPSGLSMVHGLMKYSERGEGYLNNLRTIIESNNLESLNRARLKQWSSPLVI